MKDTKWERAEGGLTGAIGACMLLWIMRKRGYEVKSDEMRLRDGQIMPGGFRIGMR